VHLVIVFIDSFSDILFSHPPQEIFQKVYHLCKKVVCVSDKELDMGLRIPLLVATSF